MLMLFKRTKMKPNESGAFFRYRFSSLLNALYQHWECQWFVHRSHELTRMFIAFKNVKRQNRKFHFSNYHPTSLTTANYTFQWIKSNSKTIHNAQIQFWLTKLIINSISKFFLSRLVAFFVHTLVAIYLLLFNCLTLY